MRKPRNILEIMGVRKRRKSRLPRQTPGLPRQTPTISEGRALYIKESLEGINNNSTKEELYDIRDTLINNIQAGILPAGLLENFIQENSGTLSAGLASTALSMSAENFKALAKANDIAFGQRYGFLAYEGEISNLRENQGIVGNFSFAEGFKGDAGWYSAYGTAEGFKGDAGWDSKIKTNSRRLRTRIFRKLRDSFRRLFHRTIK